jgi:hypothetical protein
MRRVFIAWSIFLAYFMRDKRKTGYRYAILIPGNGACISMEQTSMVRMDERCLRGEGYEATSGGTRRR